MNLEIKYDKGSMIVNLEEFINCRSISKFRKLLKLIEKSYSKEESKKILNYIEQFNENYEIDQNVTANKIVGYTDKIKFSEKQIDNCMMKREQYRKKSDGWEHYNYHLREHRTELKELQQLLREQKKDFSNRQKNKDFLDKCSILLQG